LRGQKRRVVGHLTFRQKLLARDAPEGKNGKKHSREDPQEGGGRTK